MYTVLLQEKVVGKLEDVHLGEALRVMVDEYRTFSGLTYAEIAVKIGLSPQAMSNTFGRPSVGVDTVSKLCRACDRTAWQFIAYIETGIPLTAWRFFESIMSLEGADRVFVLKSIQSAVEYIEEQHKNKVD